MRLKWIAIALTTIGLIDARAQTGARPKMEFDVASVKASTPGEKPDSNFPLGPGNVYVPNGGYFSGLTGTFDFALEWLPETRGAQATGAETEPDTSGPTLEEAIRDQLGIRLESAKSLVDILVLDHVEHPSGN